MVDHLVVAPAATDAATVMTARQHLVDLVKLLLAQLQLLVALLGDSAVFAGLMVLDVVCTCGDDVPATLSTVAPGAVTLTLAVALLEINCLLDGRLLH